MDTPLDQRRAKLDAMAKDFLENASWQLDEGSTWLHAHHDGLFDTSLGELTVDDLVGLMQAACESDAYDAGKYFLITTICLEESDRIRIDYPPDLEAALRENQAHNNEPPSLNIIHRSGVFPALAGSYGFQAFFDKEEVPACLRRCGVRVGYSCYLYDRSDLTDWGRSIHLMHVPEWE